MDELENYDDIKNIKLMANVFTENTPVYQYLKELSTAIIDKNELFKEKYEGLVKEQGKYKKDFFLSVILRTQGKRPLGLREALLSLYAQKDQDFEVILIAHKAKAENIDTIKQIVDEQAPEFKERIRYYELNEGTRTTPINYGFSIANGKYVSIFDDDDILFDNWSECFKNSSQTNDGNILHSFAFAQNWKRSSGTNYEEGYCATSAPEAIYCAKFKLLEQLVVNKCPLMTLAFPTALFQKLGIIFDESLNVTEDWEYFMRTAFLCGVADIEESTAIYRFWENVEASITLHDEDEWFQTYRKIQDGFNSKFTILPKGNISTIIELMENVNKPISESAYPKLNGLLFYSKGGRFNELECLSTINESKEPEFDLLFVFPSKFDDIQAVRIDLCERGFWVLQTMEIVVWLTNGEKEIVSLDKCVHNGVDFEDNIIFISSDPEIIFEWKDTRVIDVIHITGKINMEIPNLPFLRTSIKNISLKQYWNRWRLYRKNLF